jgi:hypothetical protein
MATKVSITLKDNEGKEEIIKKSFFGSEHLNRWVDRQDREVINIEYL